MHMALHISFRSFDDFVFSSVSELSSCTNHLFNTSLVYLIYCSLSIHSRIFFLTAIQLLQFFFFMSIFKQKEGRVSSSFFLLKNMYNSLVSGSSRWHSVYPAHKHDHCIPSAQTTEMFPVGSHQQPAKTDLRSLSSEPHLLSEHPSGIPDPPLSEAGSSYCWIP